MGLGLSNVYQLYVPSCTVIEADKKIVPSLLWNMPKNVLTENIQCITIKTIYTTLIVFDGLIFPEYFGKCLKGTLVSLDNVCTAVSGTQEVVFID